MANKDRNACIHKFDGAMTRRHRRRPHVSARVPYKNRGEVGVIDFGI